MSADDLYFVFLCLIIPGDKEQLIDDQRDDAKVATDHDICIAQLSWTLWTLVQGHHDNLLATEGLSLLKLPTNQLSP